MSTNSHLKSKDKLAKFATDLSEYDIILAEDTHLLLDSGRSNSYDAEAERGQIGRLVRPFTPRHWTYRYTVLLLIAIVQFTLNFSLDVPAGLESVLIDTMDVDVTSYALLYSVYSWPSIVLTIVGAVIVNQYLGCRFATVLFMSVLCVGQAIFAVGAFCGMFWVMMFARFLLGIGGEIAFITTDAFAAYWFKGREVSFAFGIIGAFCRLGGAGGLYVNNAVYNICDFILDKYLRLGVALSFTVCVLVIATMLSFVLALMDKHAEKHFAEKRDSKVESDSKFSLKQVLKFDVNFWVMSCVCVLYFSTIFPFVAIAQVFLRSKYGLSVNYANIADLLIFMVPIGAPIFGAIINWTGFNVYWSLAGILVACSAHLLYLLSNGAWFVPFLANSILGLSFGCVNTALWAAPPLLVEDHQLVTAYGILEAGSNFGFAVTDIVSGQLIDNFGYFVHQIFFLSLLVVATSLTVCLLCNLFRSNSCLNMSGWHQRRLRNVKKIDSNDTTYVN